jgi:DNA polymerase III subunit beta
MKFSLSKETMVKQLQLVVGVVERRQTLPILSNVLIQLDGDRLAVKGTDLEVEIVSHGQLDTAGNVAGEATVPARKLLDICRSLPDQAILNFNFADNRAIITSGRSKFTLATLPANEFPGVEDGIGAIGFTCVSGDLKQLIDKTAFAMAHQDVRYYLNGMLWEVNQGNLRAVATDGHRLAMSNLALSVGEQKKNQSILPRKGVMELSRLLAEDGSIKVEVGEHHIRVLGGDFHFTSKLVDGAYPDYDRVLPKGGTWTITGDREMLRQAFTRTAILSNEKYRGVRLAFSADLLKMSATNPDQEEAQEEIEVSYKGDQFEIGFNVNYILDVLNTLDGETVSFTLTDANSSALVEGLTDSSAVYVIMPMRL